MRTVPLFDVPEGTPVRAPRRSAPPASEPIWTRYRPKNPVKCDHCMRVLAETNGTGPIAQTARYRRRAGGTDEVLCYPHAQLQRDADGLPRFRQPRGAR